MLYMTGVFDKSRWGIWKIEESEEELWQMLDFDKMACKEKEKYNFIKKIKSQPKRMEKLAVRVLLKVLSKNKHLSIIYSSSGKPYLIGNRTIAGAKRYQYISISHTNNYVAITLSNSHPCMIDIEKCGDKILKVRERFIREDEYINETFSRYHLLLHWTAKEALYKYFDDACIDVKKHLQILPFCILEKENRSLASGRFEAIGYREKKHQYFDGFYYMEKDFVMTLIGSKKSYNHSQIN